MKLREAIVSTMTAADQTLGAVTLFGIHGYGGDAASTLTVLDGTDIKFVATIGTTANYDRAFTVGVAFGNLITDMTGTGTYSLVYRTQP